MPRFLRSLALASACALLAQVAHAQVLFEPKLHPIAPKVAPPTNFSRFAVAPWPRLDPGAIVCRTRDDLEAHSRAVAERANGQQVSLLGSADCRVLSAMTGIEIVHRLSPSETEVRVAGDPKTSWTDTWLPNTPPPH